ncbi:DUF2288 domain-containing protein [Pseudomonadota bacterium]
MTHSEEDLSTKILLETSKIEWQVLQRFFAQGLAIYVAPTLNLIQVARQISEDRKSNIQNWMDRGEIAKVSDAQAKRWIESNTMVWSAVVKPWVLVQPIKEDE